MLWILTDVPSSSYLVLVSLKTPLNGDGCKMFHCRKSCRALCKFVALVDVVSSQRDMQLLIAERRDGRSSRGWGNTYMAYVSALSFTPI